MKNMKLIKISTLFILLFSLSSSFAADKVKPSILFIGKPGVYLETEYIDELQAHDVDVFSCKWEEVNPNMLRQYNAVVITCFAYPGDSELFDLTRQRYIEEYMRKGGGVLVFLNTAGCYTAPFLRDVPEYMKKFGIDFYAEAIIDTKNEVPMSPPALQRYSCKVAPVEKITKHPITEGVRSLWYPTGWGGHATAKSTPVNHSHQWTSILETSKDAELTIQKHIPEKLYRAKRPDGPYSLLAVRNVENGRMAVFGGEPMWFVWTPYHKALGSIIMKKGEKGVPSDFWKLFENTYSWLSEPSINMGIYGKEIAKKPPIPGDTPPIAWDQMGFPAKPSKYYKGICGAHTALSTGKGTVKEWVDSAKKNGLDFLVFTEDLTEMNRRKWEKLQADCIAASNENFIAYAGLEYKNAGGNRGFILLGNKAKWIPDAYLTDDKKMINVDRGWSPQKGHGATDHKSGQIQIWLENKTNGFLDHGNNTAPFWDYKLYHMFSVWSDQNKKPLDDNLKEYLHCNSIHCNPAPYALDLLYDPEDLNTAAKNGRPFLAVSADNDPRFPEKATLKTVFNRMVVADVDVPFRLHTGGYRGWFGPIATQGPKMRLMFRAGYRWMGVSFPRYWIERHQGIEERDWYMDSWARLKIKLDAESENGIKEIKIYDGEKVIRTFYPKGAKEFSYEFNVLQNKNHHIVVVVTDMKGLKAVSREIWMEQQQKLYNYCGDHVNVPSSIYSPVHGQPYFRNIRLKRGRIDEKDLRKAKIPRDEVRRFFLDLVSPDVLIERYKTNWKYNLMELTDQYGWHNWAPHYEREDYTFAQRGYEYYNKHGKKVSYKSHPSQNVHWDGFGENTADIKDGGQPAQLDIFDNELTLKKPLELDKDGYFDKTLIKLDAKEVELILPGGEIIKNKAEGTIPSGSVLIVSNGDRGESIKWTGHDIAYRFSNGKFAAGLKIGSKNTQGSTFKWSFERIDRIADEKRISNPKWFSLKNGQAVGLQLSELNLKAKDSIELKIKNSAFDTNMQPIVVDGLNTENSIFLYVKNKKLIRPIASFNGKVYTQIPSAYKNAQLVIGNLLKSTDKTVVITAARETDNNGKPTGKWLVELYNPSDKAIETRISPVEAFDLLKNESKAVKISPKSITNIVWEESKI